MSANDCLVLITRARHRLRSAPAPPEGEVVRFLAQAHCSTISRTPHTHPQTRRTRVRGSPDGTHRSASACESLKWRGRSYLRPSRRWILPYTTHPRLAIRHILVRHEQGAGHMAEGYAQANRQPEWRWSQVGLRYQRPDPARRTPIMELDPAGVRQRPSCHERNRDRRLPGERHDRYHPRGHQSTTGSSPTPPISPGRARGIFPHPRTPR